jgi:hypothetical protein
MGYVIAPASQPAADLDVEALRIADRALRLLREWDKWAEAGGSFLGLARRTHAALASQPGGWRSPDFHAGYDLRKAEEDAGLIASQPAADLDVERLSEAIEEILGTAHGKSLASDIAAAYRDAKGEWR